MEATHGPSGLIGQTMGRREHVRHLVAKCISGNPTLTPDELAIVIDNRLMAEGLIIVPARRTTENDGTVIFPLSERLSRIGNRDNWVCQICEYPVDRLLRIPDPGAPTLDHILPKSQYSNNDDSNLQLAHRGCNNRKGDKLDYKLSHPHGRVIEAEA